MPLRARIGVVASLALVVVAVASALSACGGSSAKTAPHAVRVATWRAKDCQPAGSHGSSSYQLCWRPVGNEHGAFLRVEGEKKTALPLAPPGPTPSAKYAGRDGHWYWAALSPDGTRFLAQWSGDCEAPTSFFVSLAGGKPAPVSGERDWAKSPETSAYGWTPDGRAIVFIPTRPACGSGIFRPGIYLVSENCRRRLLWAGNDPPARLRRSLEPRTPARLRAILGPGAR